MDSKDSLEKKIAETRSEMDEEYYCLGKKVYEITDKETSKINELFDKLIEYKTNLRNLNEFIACSNCGNQNLFTNNYCYHCGEKLGYAVNLLFYDTIKINDG